MRVVSPTGHWLGAGRGGTASSIMCCVLPVEPLARMVSAVAMVVVSDFAGRVVGDALALRLRPMEMPRAVRVELPIEDEGVWAGVGAGMVEAVAVEAVERKEEREAAGEGSGVENAVPERSSGALSAPEAS